MNWAAIGVLMSSIVMSNLKWVDRAPMPLPRAGYIAGEMGGKLVIAGGSYWKDGQKYWSDRTDYFDPAKNEWQAGANLPEARSDAACATFHGSVYTFGGGQQGAATGDIWRLNANKWTRVARTIPERRLYAAAAVIGDTIYVIGGLSKPGDYSSAANTVWRWRPNAPAAAWENIAPLPGPARVSHAVAALGGKLYVFGGVTMDGAALRNLDDAYVYSPADRKWTTLPKLPVARRAWWAVAVQDRILICGGYTNDFSADVFAFDPKTGMAVKADPLPHAIADAKFLLAGHSVLTAGGESGVKVRGIWTMQGDLH